MSATGTVLDRPGPVAPQSPGLSFAGLLFANPLYRLTLAGRSPAGLRLALPSSWPEDRAVAEAALAGTLLLAGRPLPLTPIAAADAGLGGRGQAALHGFSWLLDLRALGTRAAQRAARAHVSDWIAANRGWSPVAWRSDVLGRRLAAWLIAADILIAGAEETFAPPFLASLAAQARHLARHLARLGDGAEPAAGGLAVAKGRLAAALALGIGTPERLIGTLNHLNRVLPNLHCQASLFWILSDKYQRSSSGQSETWICSARIRSISRCSKVANSRS